MFCEKCGKETSQNAQYCQSCGSAINSDDQTENIQNDSLHAESDQVAVAPITEKPIKDEAKGFLGGIHHPWRRFFARTADLMTIGILIFFLFFFLLGALFPQDVDRIVGVVEHSIVAAIVLYLLFIPVEALFLTLTGTTPAKWIFGIRVTKPNGEKLSYLQALQRTFLVFAQGEGFGIPIVTLFTRIFAYQRLKSTGTTLWDTAVDAVVTHKKWGVLRYIVCIITTLAVLTVFFLLR